MRLLSVVHNPVFGGGFNEIIRLDGPLRERGIDTVAVAPEGPGNAVPRLRAAGVEVEVMRLHRLRATPDPRVQAPFVASFRSEVRALRRLIAARGADVVQAHGDTNPHAALAAHREGRAVAWYLYDTRTPPPLRRLTMPLVRRLSDVLLTCGDAVARAYPGALALGERRVGVYPPVDVRLFRPDGGRRRAARAELGASERRMLVGAVGNRNPSKGYEWLVRALARARDRGAAVEARVLGAPSPPHAGWERRVREEAEALGVAGMLDLLDPGDRVPQLMPALDCLVLSSVPRSEGMPTVILEAMACGLPVVATDVGSVREVVEDGVTGFVVAPCDPEALAARIERLAADAALRERMGATGRARAERLYSLERCADVRAEALARAVEHRRERRR